MISDENLIVTEAFDYQRFYEDYKSEIHKLTRDEFAELNVKLRLLALQDFSKEKKYEWWNDKLDNTLKIKSLTEEQRDLIKEVKNYFILDFFDKSKNENLKKEVLKLVETNAPIVGFSNEMIYNIFMDLNSLDEELALKNDCESKQIGTLSTIKSLSVSNIGEYSKDPSPIGALGDCVNYGCIFCNPLTNCNCTTKCNFVIENCGIGGAFDCHAICCSEK